MSNSELPRVSKIDCSKVHVKGSAHGDGAYAAIDIKQGDIVEYGIVRRLTNVNGHENPYVFTWAEDRSVWATGSGASTYYNTSADANCKMVRYFDEDRFEIFALRDIAAGEELTHVYKSREWRECFQEF